MAACSTLREFDASFLKENWEMFIDDCAIGKYASCILVLNIIHCADVYIQAPIFIRLFELVWVVNAKRQSDVWVVHFKSCVVNDICYDIQADIMFELINLDI